MRRNRHGVIRENCSVIKKRRKRIRKREIGAREVEEKVRRHAGFVS